MTELDAVVVGSGPNGLAAAVALAREGRSVLVLEAEPTVGGGTRTQELTAPGVLHDLCSAIHPLGAASPFFGELPLADHGLEWLHPDVLCAHPLDDGSSGVLLRDLGATADGMGDDGRAYRRLLGPVVEHWPAVTAGVLGPLLRVPRHPVALGRFGLRALPPMTLAARRFRTAPARALLSGMAAHAFLPLHRPLTTSGALMLAAAGHVAGWPLPRGGSQRIADALVSYLKTLGGTVETGRRVTALADAPPARAVVLDVSPRQLVAIAGDRLPGRYRRAMARYPYGPGSFKVDLLLSGPVPWTSEPCRRAGTVHVGGTFEEVAEGEAAVHAGRHPERPYVLVGQQSLVDPTRAPAGQHTLWAYCHVPNGSTVDMTEAIEAQIERFAPGFRDLIVARSVRGPRELEAHNANYVGGDIAGGANTGLRMALRPTVRLDPYHVPGTNLWLCSSSTPPGGGVHGMCGYWAARSVLRRLR